MNEYARQEAIGFAEFINHGHWVRYPNEGGWRQLGKSRNQKFTTEQLYDLYLKSKT